MDIVSRDLNKPELNLDAWKQVYYTSSYERNRNDRFDCSFTTDTTKIGGYYTSLLDHTTGIRYDMKRTNSHNSLKVYHANIWFLSLGAARPGFPVKVIHNK